MLKGVAAANQESDKVITPAMFNGKRLFDKPTLFIHAVAWNIETQVGTWSSMLRYKRAYFCHVNNRARSRIPCRKQQKFECIISRKNDQIGLRISGSESNGVIRPLPGTDVMP